MLSDLYDEKRVRQGAGSGSGDDKEDLKIGQIPESVKGRVSLAKWIEQSSGLKNDSDEFAALYAKYLQANPNLPINA